jgi:hypothetical protein
MVSVKQIEDLTEAMDRIGNRVGRAIAADAAPGTDACGGRVDSLTEAAMGITAGLVKVSMAIESLADAVREHGEGRL